MRRTVTATLLAAMLATTIAASGCAAGQHAPSQAPAPPAVQVVSILSGTAAAVTARADLAVVDEALARVADAGVRHGRVAAAVVHDEVLAERLVSPRAAGRACADRRWRRLLGEVLVPGPAVVIIVGGTIPSPLPFERRAGLTCAGRPPVVLLDRRSPQGVSAAVVLLHELGHAAGFVHRDARWPRDGPANVMEEDLASRQAGRATTARDVTLDGGQAAALAALLDPRWSGRGGQATGG